MRNRPLRIAYIGWGAISRRVAELLDERVPGAVSTIALCVRAGASPAQQLPNAKIITSPDTLAELDLDLTLEAASKDAVQFWGEAALRSSRKFVVASTSAFTSTDLLDRLVAVAEKHGSQIVIPPGALAGIDALAAASALPIQSVTHRIVKPPLAWRGTEAESMLDLDNLREPATFYTGSAREAAARFPKNANVAVITAFAGIGLDKTHVEMCADPNVRDNVHVLNVAGDFGKFDIRIENRPLPTNPKTSEMAALGLVRIVENHVSTVVR